MDVNSPVCANMCSYSPIKKISPESKVCESSLFMSQSSSGILILLVSLVIFCVFLYKEVCPNSQRVSHFTTFITLLDMFPSRVAFLHIANPEPYQAKKKKKNQFIFIFSAHILVFDCKLSRSTVITRINLLY